MHVKITLCFLFLTATPAFAQAADTPLLIGGCQGCHGASGQGAQGIPSIKANHSRDEFIAIMRAFGANERPATVMGRISRGYTPDQIALLAAHYARPQ